MLKEMESITLFVLGVRMRTTVLSDRITAYLNSYGWVEYPSKVEHMILFGHPDICAWMGVPRYDDIPSDFDWNYWFWYVVPIISNITGRHSSVIERELTRLVGDYIYTETKEIELRGEIVGYNKAKKTAEIKTGTGEFVDFDIPDDEATKIIEWSFSNWTSDWCRRQYLVLVKGKATYNEEGEIVQFKPDTVRRLVRLDSVYRMQELRCNKKNWEGMDFEAPDVDGLLWVESFFHDSFPLNLRPPLLFLNDEGNISVEWSMDGVDDVGDMAFLGKIDVKAHRLEGFWYSEKDWDNEANISIDLDNKDELEQLWSFVKVFGEGYDDVVASEKLFVGFGEKKKEEK